MQYKKKLLEIFLALGKIMQEIVNSAWNYIDMITILLGEIRKRLLPER